MTERTADDEAHDDIPHVPGPEDSTPADVPRGEADVPKDASTQPTSAGEN